MPDFLIALFVLLSIPIAGLCATWIVLNIHENPFFEDKLRGGKFIVAFLTLMTILQWWMSISF